ncbi:LPXTG cell wall anchor domain-containing protein [Streptomyces sp. JJ36]|uniref:LPXTG cell wall anchor domain-containing protein n=1 Tax=Streptomyces sp. JJ36 TaxID=2736645 RepID=UPI001F027AAA|nr:LPXTG cell wall anchor domain-containing protein [Streptomyces sp. JJ36]MCF6526030.1 LPXTG cell wall anchor domain-containing protein [Streptomyces sp. JJ36]
MRIRRALAAAAATAVIAPAALLATPAYADETGTGNTTTETAETPAGEEGKTGEEDASGGEETDGETPGEETESPEPTPSTSEDTGEESESPEPTPSTSEDTGGEESESPKPTPSESTPEDEEEEPEPSASPSESEEPAEECAPADFSAGLSGFPNKIVAGSGWKEFQLTLDNSKGDRHEQVILGASVLYKEDAEGDYQSDLAAKFAEIEYFDGNEWRDELSEGGYIAGSLPVEAGEKVTFTMRIKISEKADPGAAVAIAFGVYGTEDNCYLDENWYAFEVLAPDTEPGTVGDVKPQGGKSPVDVKPEGQVGELAQTGSGSQLPMIALAGGVAVAAGAGAMYVVRRRRNAADGTAAA